MDVSSLIIYDLQDLSFTIIVSLGEVTATLDIPRSISQLISAVISDLHLYCNQTKWKANVWRHFRLKKRKLGSSIVDSVAVSFICKMQLKTSGEELSCIPFSSPPIRRFVTKFVIPDPDVFGCNLQIKQTTTLSFCVFYFSLTFCPNLQHINSINTMS